jgi:hypothetical protein
MDRRMTACPYYELLCGEEFFQHQLTSDRSC